MATRRRDTATRRRDTRELAGGLPGWTLRVGVALIAGAIVAVLAAGGIGGAALVLLGVAAVMSAMVPASPAPALLILLVALSVVAISPDPFAPSTLIMIPLVHLLHVACGIAGLLPRGARVHPAALRRPALRFAAIQAAVFAMAGLMALVPAGRTPAVLEFVAILGLAAIAGLALWLWHRPQ